MLERRGIIALLLLALAAIAYYPILNNVFGNDDAVFVNHAQEALREPSTLVTERPLGYLRPVWGLWVTVNHALFGLEPRGYFALAILMHALSAYLVWRLALRLLSRPAAACAAAVAFTVLFAPCQALMWMSAHNSALVCMFAIAMLASHLDACAAGGWPRSLRTALLTGAMLLTKETGIVAVLWLPLGEWRLRGLRACFDRDALTRYALVVAVVLGYLAANPWIAADGLSGEDAGTPTANRATLGFVTWERLLRVSAWMYAPVEQQVAPALGAVALLVPVALALVLSIGRARDALLCAALLLVAAVPPCSFRLLLANGSRLYYFPTVGAALTIGVVVAVLLDVATRRRAMPFVLCVVASAVIGFAAVHVRAIHGYNEREYGPGSGWQATRSRFDLFVRRPPPSLRGTEADGAWTETRVMAMGHDGRKRSISIGYRAVEWTDERDAKLSVHDPGSGDWRLDDLAVIALESYAPFSLGDTQFEPGRYDLGVSRHSNGEFSLTLTMTGAYMRSELDRGQRVRRPESGVVSLRYDAEDTAAGTLAIALERDALNFRFGRHRLSAAFRYRAAD